MSNKTEADLEHSVTPSVAPIGSDIVLNAADGAKTARGEAEDVGAQHRGDLICEDLLVRIIRKFHYDRKTQDVCSFTKGPPSASRRKTARAPDFTVAG